MLGLHLWILGAASRTDAPGNFSQFSKKFVQLVLIEPSISNSVVTKTSVVDLFLIEPLISNSVVTKQTLSICFD